MKDIPPTGRHSADVRMHLTIAGQDFKIGQLGPDFLILRNVPPHPPTNGEITVSIDGRLRRWRVQLPDGIIAGQPETRIMDAE